MPSSYLSSASSTFSNILTNTTSKYTTLRKQLLPLSSDERDGDTEDDTHVCRVLRAYYTEKSKPFPAWLPPDPRRPNSGGGTLSSGYGSWTSGSQGYAGQQGQAQRPNSGGRGLSDLFGPSGGSVSSTPTGSLRRNEGSTLRVPGAGVQHQQPQYQSQASYSGAQSIRPSTSPTPSGTSVSLQPTSSYGSGTGQPGGARPLPSQREGSYQSLRMARQLTPQGGGQGPADDYSGGGAVLGGQAPVGNTAQDRLKAKLWGSAGSGRR